MDGAADSSVIQNGPADGAPTLNSKLIALQRISAYKSLFVVSAGST